MNDVNKNLGHATAYGYAKSKGYTGTEDEFAALMADYAEVGERAEAAATAAAASATAASGSASDSAASATAAEGFAGDASTSAGNAAQSASQASQSATAASGSATAAAGSATQAAGSATTAGNKATEAAQSATAAAGSATAAGQSATAAQTAQTAAETAQTAAEDAAESVSASAAQIAQNTANISSVKNAIGEIDATLITEEASGAIATFTDGADGYPMRSVAVALEPIQDLHGQANPYPAGGGKNIYNNTVGDGSSGGAIFKKQSDGTIIVTASAPATPTGYYNMSNVVLPAGEYTFSGCPADGSNNTYKISLYNNTKSQTVGNGDTGSGNTFTANGTDEYRLFIRIQSGYNPNGLVFKPMICLSTASNPDYAHYEPYSNICPISGRSEVGVWRSGVNVWDEVTEGGEIDTSTGQDRANDNRLRSKNYISVKGGTSYYFCCPQNIEILQYDSQKNYISPLMDVKNNVRTTASNCAYIRIVAYTVYGTTYNNDISINYPSTDHDYHPGTVASVEVQLGQTVYGGTVDAVSGVMTVTHMIYTADGNEAWNRGTTMNSFYMPLQNKAFGKTISLCSHGAVYVEGIDYRNNIWSSFAGETNNYIFYHPSDEINTVELFKAYLQTQYANGTPMQWYFLLATPLTIQLSAQQLMTLLGTNNVWSDGGDVSVEYVADTKLYISKVIAAALA